MTIAVVTRGGIKGQGDGPGSGMLATRDETRNYILQSVQGRSLERQAKRNALKLDNAHLTRRSKALAQGCRSDIVLSTVKRES